MQLKSEQLIHHGIRGMRWGIRRYQNKDGSLTAVGKRHQKTLDKKDDKWSKKKAERITEKAKKSSLKELNQYGSELLGNHGAVNKSGKLSATTVNAYNQKMAELMSQKTANLRSPSGRVVSFVAKRGEIGVFMALADQGYNIDQLKNGIWESGRVAYKKTVIDKV